jgi:branched-chain amino acid transport system permease protein
MTDVLQTLVSGVAVGGAYAIVALGFVIVFSATGILNLAQGAFVLVGAYLTLQLGARWGLPFGVALLGSMVLCAVLAVLVERLLLRRLSPRDHGAAVLLTIGVLFVSEAVVESIWGVEAQRLGDPWGLDTVTVLDVAVAESDLWTCLICGVLIVATFLGLQRTRAGLAVRATASDQEAAIAQGIDPRMVMTMTFAAAGAVAAAAGTLLSTGSIGVSSALAATAFSALPAMVLGGTTSPGGAVVGGLLMGLVQQFTALLVPDVAPGLGARFAGVTPYLVLLLVLLIRPQGLFGRRAVARF